MCYFLWASKCCFDITEEIKWRIEAFPSRVPCLSESLIVKQERGTSVPVSSFNLQILQKSQSKKALENEADLVLFVHSPIGILFLKTFRPKLFHLHKSIR